MSGIFGLVNLDGAPVDPADIEAMRSAMAHWGPDGVQTWRDGCAALGQCLLFNTPEAVYERLPYPASHGRVAFTAGARVDNRDELFSVLTVADPERATMPDGELIFRAYEKWGEDAPDHLLGDWSFAVWHPRERKLFLARDHHGNTSLYYFRDGRRFAFASDQRALLALPQVPRTLNELYLAQVLVAWPAFHGQRTAVQDVFRVPPAHAVVSTPERLRLWRYWRLEDVPELHLGSDKAYADALFDVLQRAVQCRLRSYRPVGATLSGGLDSGSVTIIAAAELARTGSCLTAFTSVPMFAVPVSSSLLADEWALAAAVADAAGNIVHVRIRSEQSSPVAALDHMLGVHFGPHKTAGSLYWLLALFEEARQRGLGTLLTGQVGNGSISFRGPRGGGNSARSFLGEARKTISDLGAIRTRLFHRNRYGVAYSRQEPWRAWSAISSEFSRSLGLAERMRDEHFDPVRPTALPARDLRWAVLKPGRCILGANWAELGASFGLEVRDPTADRRVLSFTAAVPEARWLAADRWLIRSAMDKRLPDSVRLNSLIGSQTSDLAVRLRMRAVETREAVARCRQFEPASYYLDVPRLRRLEHMVLDREHRSDSAFAASVLLRSLSAASFLAALPAAGRPSPWKG